VLQQIIAFVTRSSQSEYERAPTALYYAADEEVGYDSTAHATLVKLLLDHGANAKIGEHCQRPALFCAALYGDTATARLLLDHGADVKMRQSDGFTALRTALMNGGPEMVRLLLNRGAQVQIQRDNSGRNDFDWAHDAKTIQMLKYASTMK
jgi:hypothetical protein